MSNRLTNILAVVLLSFMFFLAIGSMAKDSLTMDELSHIPAGYSYLTQKDMRINPEHPPLIKDLSAALPVFIKNVNFPSDFSGWKNDVNGQWAYGWYFLFQSNNPADKIIFLARLPMIAILITLGIYVFLWSKQLFGNNAGLLAVFLYSLSPTLLAHGRLVTTDVGAAAGAFIASYYFIKFLKNSSSKNLILAGVFFGLAELAKFSLILLFPTFAVLVFVWAIVKSSNFRSFLTTFCRYFLKCALITLVAYILIWGVYQYHTWNYPPEKQKSDTEFILASSGLRPLAELTVWMSDKPVLRPAAQYMLGVLMVVQRSTSGNTGFFLGEVSAAGWKNYFPVVYAIKEPLAFHILLIISLLYLAWSIKKPFWEKPGRRVFDWVKAHFTEFSMLVFMAVYWLTSLGSNLNIGVRHLLPVFPFTIVLVAGTISLLLKPPLLTLKRVILGFLIVWQACSVIAVSPHFLAYFNELAGSPKNGYIYVADSNLDWGQDLKRLKEWTDKNGIEKIYIDYFGGADVRYYFKEKYEQWQGERNPQELPRGSYLAVSATLLQSGRGMPVPGFTQSFGYYLWLDKYSPVAVIGHSIFVYKVD